MSLVWVDVYGALFRLPAQPTSAPRFTSEYFNFIMIVTSSIDVPTMNTLYYCMRGPQESGRRLLPCCRPWIQKSLIPGDFPFDEAHKRLLVVEFDVHFISIVGTDTEDFFSR